MVKYQLTLWDKFIALIELIGMLFYYRFDLDECRASLVRQKYALQREMMKPDIVNA